MASTVSRGQGWRAQHGPRIENTSGIRATGFRLLLLEDPTEETTKSGLILAKQTVDKESMASTMATVVEIGWDAWADKSTDYCDVGDRVLVGQYAGKFHTSEKDGKKYRIIVDLDIISTVES